MSKKFVTCQKAYARTTAQLMGQLPSSRVTPVPLFTHTVPAQEEAHQEASEGEGLCLPMTIKATHLDLVTDLTLEAFIAALKHFVVRRGSPTTLLTDNGTNFIGAQRELASSYRPRPCRMPQIVSVPPRKSTGHTRLLAHRTMGGNTA